jgi:hypothetical protein
LTINATGSLQTSGGGFIKTGTAGAFVLGGGSSDWPTFSPAPRTITRCFDLATGGVAATGWTIDGDGLVGPATSTTIYMPIPLVNWDGATLSQIDIWFVPASRATGALPANAPAATFYSRVLTAGASPTTRSIVTSASYVPVSYADYTNGHLKKLTLSPGITMDHAATEYALVLTDENGSNNVAGNRYYQVVCTYGVSDMRFT